MNTEYLTKKQQQNKSRSPALQKFEIGAFLYYACYFRGGIEGKLNRSLASPVTWIILMEKSIFQTSKLTNWLPSG